MNDRLTNPPTIERHLKLWIYLLPVFGIIPSIWTLYLSPKSDRTNLAENWEQKKVSRQSLSLVVMWSICYASCSMGAANMTGIAAFRLLYASTTITAVYFITCIVLMYRLSHQK